MPITAWLSIGIFAVLVGVFVYYKLSERGRKKAARGEAFVMMAIGLLNILAGDIPNEHARGWAQLFVVGSGAAALLYGLFLLVRGRASERR